MVKKTSENTVLPKTSTMIKMSKSLKSSSFSSMFLLAFLCLPEAEAWNSSPEIDTDDDAFEFIQKIITVTVTVVIIVVAVCLILCFCCPICVIAKMRQRRGVVIRTGPGATTTTNGRTVTVTVNNSAAHAMNSPPVVAVSNNYNDRNKPYPVQESVNVVPLLQPQQPQHYPPTSQPAAYPPAPQFPLPQSYVELPPPYPGLPREADTSNLPYNPYYTDESNAPTAPPPK